MTAKEMFDELGYNLWYELKTINVLCYEKQTIHQVGGRYIKVNKKIVFNYIHESFEVLYFNQENSQPLIEVYHTSIYLDEYNAITQQMKELGWLNEN